MDDNGKPYYSSVDDPKEVVWVLPKDGEVVKTESQGSSKDKKKSRPLKVHKRTNSYKEHMDDNGKPYYSSVDNPKEVVWVLPKDGEVVKTESLIQKFDDSVLTTGKDPENENPLIDQDIHVDPSSGRRYSIDEDTGHSEWVVE